MSHRRSNRPLDQSEETSRTNLDKGTRHQRITNSSRELNRNDEQTSPAGRPQPIQNSRKDLDRSSDQMKPEQKDSQRWNNQGSKQGTVERNQTTGSNVPGSEIADRTNSDEHMKKTSRESYTGNSERAGSQYSVTSESSQKMGKDLKSGHPSADSQRTHEADASRKMKSANQGMKQQGADARRDQRLQQQDDEQGYEE
jgi:hypothetical protein